MELTKEQIKVLEWIDLLLNPSNFVNAVYVTPAQGMRNAADALDREEELKKQFKRIIEEAN